MDKIFLPQSEEVKQKWFNYYKTFDPIFSNVAEGTEYSQMTKGQWEQIAFMKSLQNDSLAETIHVSK